jgi:hypothetical protein
MVSHARRERNRISFTGGDIDTRVNLDAKSWCMLTFKPSPDDTFLLGPAISVFG